MPNGGKLKKNKLQQFKDIMICFGNSQQTFFFSQKRGSIAIEGAMCTLVVFTFLGVIINIFELYSQVLLAVRLTDNLGISVSNGRNMTPAFLQGLMSQIMAESGVNGVSATISTMPVSNGFYVKNYSYGGGCVGPNFGAMSGGQMLSSLVEGMTGGQGVNITGWPNVVGLAQVAVCVPHPFYLDWAMMLGGSYATTQQQSGIMMLAIPKPPKEKHK